jgi:hypothetical protein
MAAACLVLVGAVPAHAKVLTLVFVGKVTHQDTPGVDPLVSVGDRLTATFTFDPITQQRYFWSTDSRDIWFTGDDPASFRVETSRGLRWTAIDDFNDNGVVLHFEKGKIDFSNLLWPTSTLTEPPLAIGGGKFRIFAGDGSYANLTPSLGFSGTYTLVPEPRTWMLMIAGFGAIGAVARFRRSHSGDAVTD